MKIFRMLVGLAALGFVFGCSDERNAGGVTDIGNSIAGKVVLSDGKTPAARTRIAAYDDSWRNLGIADSVVAVSDDSGRFVLENALGMRLLYASGKEGKALVGFVADSMTVVLGNSKSLSGKILASAGTVRIVGTDLKTELSANGEFSFDSIPPGDILLSYAKDSSPQSAFAFYTTDDRDTISLPALRSFSDADSLLVADASLYADSSFGAAIGSLRVTAISLSLSDVPNETLRHFAMPVKFNDKIDFSAFANPDSFEVVSENGIAQNFEVDYWTPNASQGVLWVRLDSLPAGANRVNLYVIRRDGSQKRERAFLESDSVMAALHLNGDAEIHSASEANMGFIGYGATFSDGQYVSLDSLNPFSGDFTLSVWAHWNGSDGTHQVLFSKRASADSLLFQWYFDGINSAFALYNVLHWDSIAGAALAVDTLGWNLLSLVSKNDTVSMFVNGTRVGGSIAFAVGEDWGVPLRVGGNEVAGESWNGSLDEIRVMNTARSAEWLRMEYSTQRMAGNQRSVVSD